MKKGRKVNSWTPQTFELFREAWECWACGTNKRDCGHHIFGRGKEEGCEKSPLNFAPLCNFKCHLARHGHWTNPEGKKYLFDKTLKYLINIRYTLTSIDKEFLDKYKEDINSLEIKL